MDIHSKPIAQRLGDFIRSPQFTDLPDHALSEYWRYFHDEIKISVTDKAIKVDGRSGYYTPRRKNLLSIAKRLLTSEHDRANARQRVAGHLLNALGMGDIMANMPYPAAFDAVMKRSPVAEAQLSPHRIDFAKVAAAPGAFASASAVRKAYKTASGGIEPNASIYRACYIFNILNSFDVFGSDFSFLEIGGGNGSLARLLLEKARKRSYMLDLPRTTCGAVEYLSAMRPGIRFLLPNEAVENAHQDVDVVFLTPAQIDMVPEKQVKLVVNVGSFQEMTLAQIGEYFSLADRAIEPGGFLFVYNRIEKIPAGESIDIVAQSDLIRFAEYPWRKDVQVLADEVSRLSRLTQRDNVGLRLERH